MHTDGGHANSVWPVPQRHHPRRPLSVEPHAPDRHAANVSVPPPPAPHQHRAPPGQVQHPVLPPEAGHAAPVSMRALCARVHPAWEPPQHPQHAVLLAAARAAHLHPPQKGCRMPGPRMPGLLHRAPARLTTHWPAPDRRHCTPSMDACKPDSSHESCSRGALVLRKPLVAGHCCSTRLPAAVAPTPILQTLRRPTLYNTDRTSARMVAM